MRLKIYFLLLQLSFSILIAQAPNISKTDVLTKEDIDQLLNKIKDNPPKNLKEEERSLIALKAASEKINYDDGILTSGSYLMSVYELSNKNKEVIKLGNELKKITIKYRKDPSGIISTIYRRNAVALGYLGLDDASRKDLNIALKYSESIEDQDLKNYRMSLIFQHMTMYFSNKSDNSSTERDSILYFLNQSLAATKKIKNSDGSFKDQKAADMAFTYVRLGIFYLEQANEKGSLKKAENLLLESYKIYENKQYKLPPHDKIIMLNQMSWLYIEKKEYAKSILYANSALQMEKEYKAPKARVESFEFLATSYLETGEKEKAKFYLTKYTTLKDSINLSFRNDADESMKKVVTANNDSHKQITKTQWSMIYLLSSVLFAATVILIIWRRRNKILRKNYEQMIDKLKKEQPTPSLNTDAYNAEMETVSEIEIDDEHSHSAHKNVISSRTEARILKRLETFEKSEKFLRKDLTVSLLAGQLNTNSKYLSEIIKNNKSQSFSNYINNLKINYILLKLYNEPKYRGYKISYLAEACGYASSQVFVLAFKKITGVTPSYFIQNLEEEIV
jgi:AraC-like DNA-binding protein